MKKDAQYDLSGSVGVAVVVLDVSLEQYLDWWKKIHPEVSSWGGDVGGQLLLGY